MKKQNIWIMRLKKLMPALVVFVIALGLSFLLPKTKFEEISTQMGLLTLMISRTIAASMAFVFAYVIKEWAWPSLSLTKSVKEHHWAAIIFIAAWYVVCLYCFSMGG
jgi:uncharacterized membrane protein